MKMPPARYRLRHTRRGRQADEFIEENRTPETTSGTQIDDGEYGIENEVFGRPWSQRTYEYYSYSRHFPFEDERRQPFSPESRQTADRRTDARQIGQRICSRPDTPFSVNLSEKENNNQSRPVNRYSYNFAIPRTRSDVNMRSRGNSNMAANEFPVPREFDYENKDNDLELPSNVKYRRTFGSSTPIGSPIFKDIQKCPSKDPLRSVSGLSETYGPYIPTILTEQKQNKRGTVNTQSVGSVQQNSVPESKLNGKRPCSREMNSTFTQQNDRGRERDDNDAFYDDIQQHFVAETKFDTTDYESFGREPCQDLSKVYQIVEVTCRSASNSSTFYNIVSYDNNVEGIQTDKENIETRDKRRCEENQGQKVKRQRDKDNIVKDREVLDRGMKYQGVKIKSASETMVSRKRDAATNTTYSVSDDEFDFDESISGKVSQNSVASDEFSRMAVASSKTSRSISEELSKITEQNGSPTESNDGFEIPNCQNSCVSSRFSNASRQTDSANRGLIHITLIKARKLVDESRQTGENGKCTDEVEGNQINIHSIGDESDSNTKQTQTDTQEKTRQENRKQEKPLADSMHLESRDNVVQPKVDTWHKDWIPSSEYKRNENFQIFSQYVHFDQVQAKVNSWKNDWCPSWSKPREQVNVNKNQEFIDSLQYVNPRIDTGTRNKIDAGPRNKAAEKQWSRHDNSKTKIKSAPVNKKKPTCPQGPRRTRD